MLETIKITNLALIEKSVINFNDGFNVLTGETGAGKSLVVDALLFLTGIRADKTLIKSGEEYARVEGVFSVDIDNNNINEILKSIDIENEGTLIISRYFALNGKNECRVNGEIITLNILRKLSCELLDIFGQNDSQLILDNSNHLQLIDEMIGNRITSSKEVLSTQLDNLKSINNQIIELGGLDADRENNIKLLTYEIDEIDNADLTIGLEEEIKSKISIMQNSEKIYNSLNSTIDALDGDFSIVNAIKFSINNLSNVEEFDIKLSTEKDRLYSIKYELEDIIANISSEKSNITYSEADLDMLQDRLMEIKDLERKYGATIADILDTRENKSNRLDKLLNADEELNNLVILKNNLLKDIYNTCLEIRKIRKEEISKFRLQMINELQELGMKSANFDVQFINDINLDEIEKVVTTDGADKLEFLFSANLGVELRPLTKIISGGELSRFMLAFKSLQNSNSSKTCIFDEIDTGIGGEIGVVIGKKISKISRYNRVICITHLPQIACYGDTNFKIEKFEEDNKTITSVTNLNNDGKVTEIARMLGSSSSSSSNSHAREIIKDADLYKNMISNKV